MHILRRAPKLIKMEKLCFVRVKGTKVCVIRDASFVRSSRAIKRTFTKSYGVFFFRPKCKKKNIIYEEERQIIIFLRIISHFARTLWQADCARARACA